MPVRLFTLLIALAALSRAASACPAGSKGPCRRGMRNNAVEPTTIVVIATSFTHASKGAVPAFSLSAISKFLAQSTWTPVFESPPPSTATPNGGGTQYIVPSTIQFMTAAKLAKNDTTPIAQVVTIRRIEKHGKAILVEVDDQVFQLAACPDKKGYACLLPTSLALRPVKVPQ